MSAISASRGAPLMPLPTRSVKRAATSRSTVDASGNTGLVTAARPYPTTASSLRLPSRSERAPEKIFVMDAVASAMPSMKPTVTIEVPSTVTRYTGSRVDHLRRDVHQ